MKKINPLVVASMITALSAGTLLAGTAGESARPIHPIIPASGAIRLDGILDEAAWEGAWSTEVPFEVTPGENTPAPVRTVVLVTHDSEYLYAGIRAYDPDPSAIRAHFTDRDAAWDDDWVGLVLDTFNDERRDFLFVVNPHGIQMDNIEVWSGGGSNWDGIWDAACRIESWGWAAEFKIPFSTLSFQRTEDEQVWGFDAVRGYNRGQFKQMGAFARDRNSNCYLCQAIKVRGFKGVAPGRNIEIDPTLTAVRTETGSGAGEQKDVEAGITAKWGVTPNLTMTGTVNPDFSQVEADALQLDLNQPFALFYDEKRPFFMEGADFFSTPMSAIYTRTLREPSWGLKLTGKQTQNTLASFVVQDDTTNLILPGSTDSSWISLDTESTASVLRYKRDLGSDYTLGFLGSDRRGDGYSNGLFGMDGDLRFSSKDRIMFQLMRSSTKYPGEIVHAYDQPEGTFEDLAGFFHYRHSTRNFTYVAEYIDVGEDFRADMGFIPRVGYQSMRTGAAYEWLPSGETWFSSIYVEVMGKQLDDTKGDLLLRDGYVILSYMGPLDTHAFIQYNRTREAYAGRTFDLRQYRLHDCMRPAGSTYFYFNLYGGDRIDYTNVKPGRWFRASLGGDEWVGRHLRLNAAFIYERMTEDAERLYIARIAQLTTSYQFTARTFARLILQGVHYDYNPRLYTDERNPEYRHLLAQFLFSYKVNPRTVLFLGYTDNREGEMETDLAMRDRTVFAKIGYAWNP